MDRPTRALLLYPEMPDTMYSFRHLAHAAGRKAAFPPLGLLTIASMLPETWELRLVDTNVNDITDADLAWANVALISAMNVQEASVRSLVEQLNDAGIPIVAGGPLFTHEHDRFTGIDHFVLGEAEITLPRFLEDWQTGQAAPRYEQAAHDFADVSTTPLPDMSLVDLDDYVYAVVQYSRGCPYMCDFCDVTALFGRRPRTKSFEHMAAELETLMASGAENMVLFADDNLIGNKRLLKEEFLPKLIEWRRRTRCPLFFATQLTINLVDDEELMDLLLEAGFRNIFIGIETPEEDSLKGSAKHQNMKRDMLEDVRRLHRKGFIVAGGFIVGFDTDSDDVFERQRRFIQSSGITLPIINILKAPPGTELFDRMKREERLVRDFAFSEGETNIRTVMPPEPLFSGFSRLIEQVLFPDGSLERVLTFLETYRYPTIQQRIPVPLTWKSLRSAGFILWRVGVKSRSRRAFWQIFRWALRNRPGNLDLPFIYGALIHQMDMTARSILEATEREKATHKQLLQAA